MLPRWNHKLFERPRPFAFGGRDDAEILALFRQWLAELRAINETHFGNDGALNAACARLNDLAERLFAMEVEDVVGVAIKAYMSAYEIAVGDAPDVEGGGPELGRLADGSYACRASRDREGEWDEHATAYLGAQAMCGLLASAAKFVPDLEPLVEETIASPFVLPFEDDETEDAPVVELSS